MNAGTLPILTYHSLDTTGSVVSVDPRRFEDQMATVESMGYHAVCLREAVARRRESGRWPQRTVVLTFDDGYENLHRHALPTLARLRFSATVFLVTGHIGGRNDWDDPLPGLGLQSMLGWSQVGELVENGWEVGAHTVTHPDLRGLPASDVERQMRSSRTAIEDRLRQPVESFAYPYGHANDSVISIAEREFGVACLTELRSATVEPLHELPRIDAHYLQKPGRMRRLLEGRLDRYVTVRRWGRRVRAAIRPNV